eukprot:s1103_g4.t1
MSLTGDLRYHGFPFPLGPGVLEGQPTRVRQAGLELNRRAGYKFESPIPQHAHRAPTAVQLQVLSRLHAAVDRTGPCPDGSTPSSALQDLMSTHNLYEGEPGNLARYDPDKLKILRSRVRPRPLSEMLPPHVLPLFRRRHAHIVRSDSEFETFKREHPDSCPHQPYWDPSLRQSLETRVDFLRWLYSVGIISFRRRIRSKVDVFFVKKKDPNAIRMVIDARVTNAHHRAPPVTRLGSGANFSELDLSQDGLRHHKLDGTEIGWGTEMDVSDCFYQFDLKEMASWFGIDFPNAAHFWRRHGIPVEEIYNEESGSYEKVDEYDMLYPVISVMPMGWTWALFFANETVAHLVRQSKPEGTVEFREKLQVPQLWDADTLTSTYVDNVAILGAHKHDVSVRAQAVAKVFEENGIPIVWSYEEPVRKLETVGCIIDFEEKKLRQKPHRIWRVHLAGIELARRRKVHGHLLQVWLGHATSLFRFAPPLLSIFDKIYRFIRGFG